LGPKLLHQDCGSKITGGTVRKLPGTWLIRQSAKRHIAGAGRTNLAFIKQFVEPRGRRRWSRLSIGGIPALARQCPHPQRA